MEEHAVELIHVLLTVIAFLLAGMLWFSRLFVARLFQKIDELEHIFKEGMDERRKVEGQFYEKVNDLTERIVVIETNCEYFQSKHRK